MDQLNVFIGNVVALIINPLIWLLMAAAFAYFIWGAAFFILHAGDETKRKEGKSHLLWGLIGIFVMVSVFGILNVVLSTFCHTTVGPGGAIWCPGG